MVRAKLVTRTSGTVSAAPHATLLTVAHHMVLIYLWYDNRRHPAASALRRHAPKLCGIGDTIKNQEAVAAHLSQNIVGSVSLSCLAGLTLASRLVVSTFELCHPELCGSFLNRNALDVQVHSEQA